MSRILVTGMGLVTPFGRDLDQVWDAIYAGKCAVKNLTDDMFPIDKLYCKLAAFLPNDEEIFPMKKWREKLPKASKFVLYGLEAAKMALLDAGLLSEDGKVPQDLRIGVIVGSGIGGLEENFTASKAILEKGSHRVSPYFVTTALINLVAGHIAIEFQIKGPNQSQVTACSTGAHAIADGARMIKEGRCDIMVVGAAESAIGELGIGGFSAIKALANGYNETPEKGSRPWDQARSGFVMGEGAGILVLESEEHAKKRKVQKIYCEFAEAGLTNDAYHVTAPCEDGDGAMRAIKQALERAKMAPEDVDYINAHATSTPPGDRAEIRAIKAVFGGVWDKISVSSVKGAIGHMLGGSGAVESVLTALCVHKQAVLPTLNLENPDPEAFLNRRLVDLVPGVGKSKRIRVALKDSFGFGGHNAALLFKEYE